MVCAKDDDVEFDFLTQGLNLLRDGDYITADGTSLGADNGIGVAYILALLDSSDIPHPPLEAVLTSMEEKGKVGGANFDTSLLRGTRMIDFNWITDEEILAGCGGDVSAVIDIPAEWEPRRAGPGRPHADRPRAHRRPLRVRHPPRTHQRDHPARARAQHHARPGLRPARRRAVRRGAEQRHRRGRPGHVVMPSGDADALEVAIKDVVETVASEYEIADPNVRIDLTPAELAGAGVLPQRHRRLTRAIVLMPNGVRQLEPQDPRHRRVLQQPRHRAADRGGLPADGHHHVRGDLPQARRARPDAGARGARGQRRDDRAVRARRPRVPLVEDSALLELAKRAYRESYGREPNIQVSNCSLELGMFSRRLPGLDTISIGTELHWLHSKDEKFSISSVQGTWKFIQTLIPTLR